MTSRDTALPNRDIGALLNPAMLAEVRRIELKTRRTMSADTLGAYRSAFRGTGLTFADLRSYEPGDEIKNIHWKATARTGKVQVKTFDEERQLNIVVAIDVSPSTVFGRTKKNIDKALQFAALITMLARSSGDAIGLCLFGEEVIHHTPPARRRSEVQRCLTTLLGVSAAHGRTDIGGALRFLSERQRKSAVIFLVSDFISAPFSSDLQLLARKHDVVCVALRDPLDFDLPAVGLATFKDPETGRACLIDTSAQSVRTALAFSDETRRAGLRRACELAGADLIEIVEDPLSPLAALMHRRTLRRR